MSMPMMDIGHVSMFMLGAWVFMFMRMGLSCRLIRIFVLMKFVGPGMSVFVHDRHVDVKVRVLFVCQ